MQDIDDNDSSQQYLRSSKQDGHYQRNPGPGQPGFIVAGAPWEQQAHPQGQQRFPVVAPNTASNEEFPSFGETGNNSSGGAPLWGPRR